MKLKMQVRERIGLVGMKNPRKEIRPTIGQIRIDSNATIVLTILSK
jgi:hypothetical protein